MKNFYFFLKLFRNYDCIHIILPTPFVAIYSLFVPSSTNISIHFQAEASELKFYKIYKILETKLLKKSNSIIASSSNLANSPTLKPYISKVSVLPNCLSDDDYVVPNKKEVPTI